MKRRSAIALCGACLAFGAAPVPASARQHAPATLVTVPYIAQTPLLCGGAALAMVLRYWGARDVHAEDFAPLVDTAEGGIRASALAAAATDRGWLAVASTADTAALLGPLEREVERGRPVIVLIEEGVTRYHYVVVSGFTPTSVVVHDPARAPFRVLPRATFQKAWDGAGRWLLLVLPDDANRPTARAIHASSPLPDSAGPCTELVRRQVALAKENQLEDAGYGLEAAASLCPAEALVWRELAGLRFVQKRYGEAANLAERARGLSPTDRPVLELLAGARFMNGDFSGALGPWNQIGEPRIDLVTIDGLKRTHHAVVIDHLQLTPRQLLTPKTFGRVRLRLAELPTVSASRLTYQPSPDGTADISVIANERPVVPRGAIGWGVTGISAAFRRELRLDLSSPLHEGELWTVAYRFSERRTRGLFGLALPSRGPLPGITELEGLWEEQTYAPRADAESAVEVQRRRLFVGVSDWATGALRWQAGASWDRFRPSRRYVSLETRATLRGLGDRAALSTSAGRWMAVTPDARGFTIANVTASFRSHPEPGRRAFVGTGGVRWTSRDAELPLWPVAGSSDGRGVLLRAHPLYDAGYVRTDTLGRRLVHATLEYEQAAARHPLGSLGVAGFVDTARVSERLFPGRSPLHVDIGVGARIDAPGLGGRLRLDLAHGLRDRRTSLSAGVVAAWGR